MHAILFNKAYIFIDSSHETISICYESCLINVHFCYLSIQVMLPVIFVCFSMLFATLIPPIQQPSALRLVPWLYGSDNYVFYSQDNINNSISAKMEDALVNGPGIGVRCMPNSDIGWVITFKDYCIGWIRFIWGLSSSVRLPHG